MVSGLPKLSSQSLSLLYPLSGGLEKPFHSMSQLLICKLGMKMRDCSFSLGCCEAWLSAESEVVCPESFIN